MRSGAVMVQHGRIRVLPKQTGYVLSGKELENFVDR